MGNCLHNFEDNICKTCGEVGKDEQTLLLWKKFADVPVNDEDCIDVNFDRWEAGTDKLIIWHWFDDNYSGGLKALMRLE